MPETHYDERSIILLLGAVQFVNIVDFMMVMPLGPDLAHALGIATSHIGYLGGSYTAAAAVTGILGATFLDRFDRRSALGLAMLGLAFGTLMGGIAHGFWTLILARIVAGAFGGPATALALAIVSDVVPPERRGKALGTVMTAFSVASILGVPAGLEIARYFGWRAPFFVVAVLCVAITSIAVTRLPRLRAHLDRRSSARPPIRLLDPLSVTSLFGTAATMLGVFAVVPNISAFLQHNLGYPREHLGLLYLLGGTTTFFATRRVGMLVDRFGATCLISAGTVLFALALFFGFIRPVAVTLVIFVFPLLMLSGSVRGVPMNTLASRVPRPEQRARFMSAQSAVQHLASSVGALSSAVLLRADSDGRLIGMPLVAMLAIVIAALVPALAWRVERGVKEREAGPVDWLVPPGARPIEG
jgi:predicted MFS family arabinose efflux permease